MSRISSPSGCKWRHLTFISIPRMSHSYPDKNTYDACLSDISIGNMCLFLTLIYMVVFIVSSLVEPIPLLAPD